MGDSLLEVGYSLHRHGFKMQFGPAKDELAFKIDLDIISNNLNEVEKSLPPDIYFSGKTLFIKGQKSDYINKTNNAAINFGGQKLINRLGSRVLVQKLV